ncbi:ketopantoate reductase family protein [Palleronia sp. KMU-117]|uniref:ketopantoate reductase family protein n=1 Tax=Palleronia sp. KMU-117 TaxID=3434108 RepID=UPI003D71DE0A
MKIAVMGAGGIGGYVGGRLAEAGAEVTLIARGAHLDALRRNGLTIETPQGTVRLPEVRAVGAPAEVGPVDLVLFTVKLADAEGAAGALAPLLGPQTRILTLQNGIDSKAILERQVGAGRVAEGIIYLAAYIREPGVIWHPGGVHLARADASPGDPVMAALFALNDRLTDLDILPDADARQMVWGKFVNLAAFAGVTSIARSPIGRVYETPATLGLFRDLLRENLAVARAEGLRFPDAHVETTIALFRDQPYEQKSSMLVDLEAGKPIEMPWLSGRVVELAQSHGLAVPANRAVVAALAPFVTGTPAR